MSAEETLNLIAKQWCTLEDIMKLGNIGRNSALKAKKKIKDKLEELDIFYLLITENQDESGVFYAGIPTTYWLGSSKQFLRKVKQMIKEFL